MAPATKDGIAVRRAQRAAVMIAAMVLHPGGALLAAMTASSWRQSAAIISRSSGFLCGTRDFRIRLQ